MNLLYSYRIDPKFKVFGGLGPYFSYNLSGTEKGNFSGDSTNNNAYTFRINNKLKFNNKASYAFLDQSNYSPIDIGLDILLLSVFF